MGAPNGSSGTSYARENNRPPKIPHPDPQTRGCVTVCSRKALAHVIKLMRLNWHIVAGGVGGLCLHKGSCEREA